MGRYVSIRRNGSLAALPTSWLFAGIVAACAAVGAAAWLQFQSLNGAVSHLGVLLWMGTASVCLFTAVLAGAAEADRSRVRFLLAGGLLSFWLGLDELFAIHAAVLPALGVPQAAITAAYASAAGGYLLASWRAILGGRPSLFLMAGAGLGASLGAELLIDHEAVRPLMEDGLKLLGIAFWAGFHVAAAGVLAEELMTGRVTTVAVSSARLMRRLARPASGPVRYPLH